MSLCIAGYVLLVVIPTTLAERSYEGAKQIGQDIRDAFQFTPEITVKNTVVLQQQSPIMELATVSQQFQREYEWKNTRLKSTKKITIKGTFEAKAGFDLHKKFTIQINDDKAIVTLPPPQLLSLTSAGDVTFEDENGYWNWIDNEDRTKAINAFTTDARQYAEQAGFVTQAQNSLQERLTEILKAHGKSVEIRYEEGVRLEPMR